MDKKKIVRFPEGGLIKTADQPLEAIAADQRVKLNRRGNELFNQGDIEAARRIFQTTGYSDGLIRVGERYYAERKPVDALKMYWLAHDGRRVDELTSRIAQVIQKLLEEAEEVK